MKTSNKSLVPLLSDWMFILFMGAFLLLFNYKSRGQASLEWKINYNQPSGQHARGLKLVTDGDCHVYIAGTTWNGVNPDYLIVKLDLNGDTIWTRSINGSGNGDDTPTAMVMDNSGNLFVTGESLGAGTGLDYYTVKINPQNGQVLNTHRSGNTFDDHPVDVAVGMNGEVVVTGYGSFHHDANSQEDFYTVWYDNSLTLLCSVPGYAGFNRQDYATDLILDPNGTFFLPVGNSLINSDGNWMVNEVGPSIGGCTSANNLDGVTGATYEINKALLSTGNSSVFLAGTWNDNAAIRRYDNPGNLFLFSYQYEHAYTNGGSTVDGYISMVQSGNSIYVCGYMDGDAGAGINKNVIAAKYNINAVSGAGPDWVSLPFNGSGSGEDIPVGIVLSNSVYGNIFVAGTTTAANGLKQMFVLQFDTSDPNPIDTIFIPNTSGFDEVCTDVARDDYGNIILTGYQSNPAGNQLVAAKICTNPYTPSITWTSTNILLASTGDTYQWYMNGNALTGETSQSLDITLYGSGNYNCEITRYCCNFNSASNVVSVGVQEEEALHEGVSVYPNPAWSKINIINNGTELDHLAVYDISGRLIFKSVKFENNKHISISLADWDPGIYYLTISGNKETRKVKFIKL
jgi:hypothetical protein